MVKVKERGWSGSLIRVKSDWIWPLYLAVPLCDLLFWAPDIGVLRTRGGISNLPVIILEQGFYPGWLLRSQAILAKTRVLQIVVKRLNHCWSVSLWCAASFSSWSWSTWESLMPEKCPERCRVSGWTEGLRVTCTSHFFLGTTAFSHLETWEGFQS